MPYYTTPNLTISRRIMPRPATAHLAKPQRALSYLGLTSKVFLLSGLHKRMTVFVALNAKGLEIGRVICPVFGQFQNVVTMALEIFDLFTALLTDTLITFINPLLKRYPQANGHTSVPGEPLRKTVNFEIVHNLALPDPASPCRTFPKLAKPDRLPSKADLAPATKQSLARPHLARPRLAVPCHILPRHTAPDLIRSDRTLTAKHNRTLPCFAMSNRAKPYHAVPCRTSPSNATAQCIKPDPALTTKLLQNLKLAYAKPPKLRTIVAYANRLTGQCQHILHKAGLYLVVNHFYFKFKLPTRGKRGAYPDHAATLNNHRTHIQVKRFVRVRIQHFGIFHPVGDFFRVDKHGGLKQVFVRLAAFARDFEIDSGFNHSALKVAGRLKDFIVSVHVKILAPFLRVVFSARVDTSPLGHIGQIGDRETMLHQRRIATNFNTDGIHNTLLTTKQSARLVNPYLSGCTARTMKPRLQDGHFTRDNILMDHEGIKKARVFVQPDADIIPGVVG